jgi:hypothetical protein
MGNLFQTGIISLGESSPSALTIDTSTFTQVNFPTPFPTGSRVIVIPMVQTFKGPHSPGLRIANVTNKGFKIRINELVTSKGALSDGVHNTEQIGYVAFTVDYKIDST